MDIEFHYNITYLIAVRSGFTPGDAQIIAQASQGIDDNHIPMAVSGAPEGVYKSEISQSMDVTRPEHAKHVYPVFHFIPGDKNASTAVRADGLTHDWVTTPNNLFATQMLGAALDSRDLHRIGVAAHGYVDTWAHQNFVGYADVFNNMDDSVDMKTMVVQTVENILIHAGHGAAEHKPDIPGLIWIDSRAVSKAVDNRSRFLEAAENLFRKLAQYNGMGLNLLEDTARSLVDDLRGDIGACNPNGGDMPALRIQRYKARARTEGYGKRSLQDYDPHAWLDDAVQVDEQQLPLFQELRTKADRYFGDYADIISRGVPITGVWISASNYKLSQWYKFQEAVKKQLELGWAYLNHLPGASEIRGG